MKVGFIGLGSMGAGMAANLLKAGHSVSVYNRTAARVAPLVNLGAQQAKTVAEACRAEAVVTMLANDEAVEKVVFGDGGLIASAAAGSIHISMSTISVDMSDRLASAHMQAQQRFIAAPVFGRPQAAADGQLFIVAGGQRTTVEACSALFDALGQKLFYISSRSSDANLVKLSGNFMIASVIESLSEALALIGKSGIDQRQYLEVLTSTLFNTPLYKNYGAMLIEQKFEPAGFAASLGLKDMRLTLAAAEQLRVPMPLLSLLRDRFVALLAQGGEALDWSAIGRLSAADSGQSPAR